MLDVDRRLKGQLNLNDKYYFPVSQYAHSHTPTGYTRMLVFIQLDYDGASMFGILSAFSGCTPYRDMCVLFWTLNRSAV